MILFFKAKLPTELSVVLLSTLIGISYSKNILDKNLTPEEIQSFAHPNISGDWVSEIYCCYIYISGKTKYLNK